MARPIPAVAYVSHDGQVLGEVGRHNPKLPAMEVVIAANEESSRIMETELRVGRIPLLPIPSAPPAAEAELTGST